MQGFQFFLLKWPVKINSIYIKHFALSLILVWEQILNSGKIYLSWFYFKLSAKQTCS